MIPTWIEWSGDILFLSCLSQCLFVRMSVVNYNLWYNFWTVRDIDFISGMYTPLLMPFQVTQRSMTLWSLLYKLRCPRDIVFHKNILMNLNFAFVFQMTTELYNTTNVTTTVIPVLTEQEKIRNFFIGLFLAIIASCFTGTSFIFKKLGLRKLNKRAGILSFSLHQRICFA